MSGGNSGRALIAWAAALLLALGCAARAVRTPSPDSDLPCIDRLDSGSRYLSEGFISDETFRVVIVLPKQTGETVPGRVFRRARERMRASLERTLSAHGNRVDKDTKVEISGLIEKNGRLAIKDSGPPGYDVYYFDVTKKNLKAYLKNLSCRP